MKTQKTIVVHVPFDTPRLVGEPGTLSYAIWRRDMAADAIIVERIDHPYHMGEKHYYAIHRAAKRLWTGGEREVTQDMVADAWYAQGCPEVLEAL